VSTLGDSRMSTVWVMGFSEAAHVQHAFAEGWSI
jgi:hypothetical protein